MFRTILNMVFIGQMCWVSPCAYAQSDDSGLKNTTLTPYLFQFGFGEDLSYAKNDLGGLVMMKNPVIKSEGQAIVIPSFYLGFRINEKYGLQAAYNGIWKSTRAAAYAGSYYDPGGTNSNFGILDYIFELFGIDVPDDYAPSEPGWRNIADGISWETWTDLYSLRLSYNVFENRRFRASVLAGPGIAISYESINLNAHGIQQFGDHTYVNAQSDYFNDRYTNLNLSAGARVECKFLRRMSLMAFVDGAIPVTKARTSEHSVEIMHYNEMKQLSSVSHEIDTRSFRLGLGLLIGI